MKKDQDGFGAIEGLLVLVVIGIVGFTGWYVLQSKSETNKVLDNAAAGIVDPRQESTSTDPTPRSSIKYLEVPEYGVKFALSSDITDAYYEVNSDPNGGIYLRVHSLDIEPTCKTGNESPARLVKVGKDEVSPLTHPENKKYSEVMKGVVINDYFYWIGPGQSACVRDSKNLPLLEKVRAAFSEASSTIEKL